MCMTLVDVRILKIGLGPDMIKMLFADLSRASASFPLYRLKSWREIARRMGASPADGPPASKAAETPLLLLPMHLSCRPIPALPPRGFRARRAWRVADVSWDMME